MILEPERSITDIEKEAALLAERKLVGKPPIVNLEGIGSLTGAGSFGSNGGSGGQTSAPGSIESNNRSVPPNGELCSDNDQTGYQHPES